MNPDFARTCRLSAALVGAALVSWGALAALAVRIHLVGLGGDFALFTLPLMGILVPLLLHRLLLRRGWSSPGVWSLLATQLLLVAAGGLLMVVLSPWLFASNSGADPAQTMAWLVLAGLVLAGEICGLAYGVVRPLPPAAAKVLAGVALVGAGALLIVFVWFVLAMQNYGS